MFEALIMEKRVLADDVWARVRRQFEANKLAMRALHDELPAGQPDARCAHGTNRFRLADAVAGQICRPHSAPAAWYELAALAIGRIARNDPLAASEQLRRIESELQPGERAGRGARSAGRRHSGTWTKRCSGMQGR